MTTLRVERLGGLAGFGSSGSRLRSQGEIELSSLSDEDRTQIDALFRGYRAPVDPGSADQLRYRLTRGKGSDEEAVIVMEAVLPLRVRACVRDEIR